ncbi:phosphotransferase [Metallumcola ferriviriculae]|uniref:protein-tyrosine-phosphatase n=1 Tax=Metallumcola ferriviriculae TaxID=3039180 RepID=A0AAU0UKQ5_9FIRM|nr:phosphotransferase [Desulfitibacteraceae bacterium MK1]
MIDLHAHVLPGLDDGVCHEHEALLAVKQALSVGFNQIVAIAHVRPEIYENSKNMILEATSSLNHTLLQHGIDAQLLSGAEYYLVPELTKQFSMGLLLTVNNTGNYLLVELPKLQLPLQLNSILFDLQLLGVTPILAHPERNQEISQNPAILINLVKRGVLVQITAGSLMGLFGRDTKKVTEFLLRKRLVHVMASDMHGPGRRMSIVRKAIRRLKCLVGEKDAHLILKDNPKLIIQGRTA